MFWIARTEPKTEWPYATRYAIAGPFEAEPHGPLLPGDAVTVEPLPYKPVEYIVLISPAGNITTFFRRANDELSFFGYPRTIVEALAQCASLPTTIIQRGHYR